MDSRVGNCRVRNALSIVLGILTVVSCLLWARSYYRVDVLYGNLPGLGAFEIYSCAGWLELVPGPRNRGWAVGTHSIEERLKRVETIRQFNLQMAVPAQGTGPILRLPLGILVAALASAFVFVQIKRPPRFSLRALLVATMLVAVGLGLGVWLLR